MIDCYTHLDMASVSPVDDMHARMAAAGLDRALAVETWSGANRSILEELEAVELEGAGDAQFRVAYCYREQARNQLRAWLGRPRVVALRVKTSHLQNEPDWIGLLAESDRYLLVHADKGVGALARLLPAISARWPDLRIYVPHLAWPRRQGQDDPDWRPALEVLTRIPRLVLGISALAHFSLQPFPHDDVRRLAQSTLAVFGPHQVVAGSDYPLFDRDRYPEYMALATRWILDAHPAWSDSGILFAD
jgi:predicted TIM-barrel fold metal-dependent hydrolase